MQLYQGMMSFIISTEAAPLSLLGPAEEVLRGFNPNLAMGRMTLAGLVDDQLSSWSIWATLLGVLAAVALFLAVVGLYGVQSFLVTRRTKEIGIRIALGAQQGSLVSSVVRSGLLLGGIGAVVGVGAAIQAGAVHADTFFIPLTQSAAVAQGPNHVNEIHSPWQVPVI